MGVFSDKTKKESKSFSDLSEKELKEILKSGKVPEITPGEKKDRRQYEAYMKKLEKLNSGQKHSGIGGTIGGLRDAAKGKPASRTSGKMPSGPVNRDGTPRKSWW